MKTDNTPLYKKLNSERTQGALAYRSGDTDSYAELLGPINSDKTVCIFPKKCFVTEAEAKANAQYITIAANNLHQIAEALELLANQINLSKLNIRKDFSLINAHANALKALNKIS